MILDDKAVVEGGGSARGTTCRSRRSPSSPPLLDILVAAVLVPLLFISAASGLRITELSVPAYVDVGDSAELVCHHELQDATLLSVKWYKDESEFFRYTPGDVPDTRTFPLAGVNLDLASRRSSDTKVTLTQLSSKSSGVYRCEVSADAPKFETVHRESRMEVMVLPREDVKIHGVEKAYSLGTVINATCKADRSKPKADLQWFINGQPAQSWQVGHHLQPQTPQDRALDAVAVSVGLSFTLERTHFPGGRLDLRCRSTIGNITGLSREASWTAMLDSNRKLAQRSPATRLAASLATLLLPLSLLRYL